MFDFDICLLIAWHTESGLYMKTLKFSLIERLFDIENPKTVFFSLEVEIEKQITCLTKTCLWKIYEQPWSIENWTDKYQITVSSQKHELILTEGVHVSDCYIVIGTKIYYLYVKTLNWTYFR